jgi:hypothetical protein
VLYWSVIEFSVDKDIAYSAQGKESIAVVFTCVEIDSCLHGGKPVLQINLSWDIIFE